MIIYAAAHNSDLSIVEIQTKHDIDTFHFKTKMINQLVRNIRLIRN